MKYSREETKHKKTFGTNRISEAKTAQDASREMARNLQLGSLSRQNSKREIFNISQFLLNIQFFLQIYIIFTIFTFINI